MQNEQERRGDRPKGSRRILKSIITAGELSQPTYSGFSGELAKEALHRARAALTNARPYELLVLARRVRCLSPSEQEAISNFLLLSAPGRRIPFQTSTQER